MVKRRHLKCLMAEIFPGKKKKDSNQHILKAQEIQRNADLGPWTRVKSEQRQRS